MRLSIVIIGAGFVGAASAFALMQSGLFSEIALVDVDRARAEGEALDISHGSPFAPSRVQVYATDYDGIADAQVVVVTAGAAQKPGETRLDLVAKNVAIFKSIIPELKKRNFAGILVVVANPVDILTLAAVRYSGLPENRVIGSGTVLDTARLRTALGDHLNIDSRSVHSFIIGEHGDSEMVAWSSATVAGVPLMEFCEKLATDSNSGAREKIAAGVKNAAYEIIARKHATYYGIAMSVVRICRAIVMNERSILPISSVLHGEYGIEGVALSLPAIVGENGLEKRVLIPLNDEEKALLRAGAKTLKETAASVNL